MLTSILAKQAGFYSQFFFVVNHLLFAKKYNMSFEINSINWLFKYKDGWEDYFQTIKLYAPNKENHIQLGHHQVFEEFSVREYKAAIKDIYIYNDSTKEYIQCIKNKLNLVDKEYDSIFIRRGDKLGGESDYIKTEAYIEVLLQKNSNCRTIFLQTDDYNCILDANQYMRDHNLNINIITLCQENSKGGVMVFRKNQAGVEEALCEHKKNQDYISLVIDNLRNSIAVDDMSPNEIYDTHDGARKRHPARSPTSRTRPHQCASSGCRSLWLCTRWTRARG
jgi:hypothetical protein